MIRRLSAILVFLILLVPVTTAAAAPAVDTSAPDPSTGMATDGDDFDGDDVIAADETDAATRLQQSVPMFLQDDEAVETQLRQLQIFYRHNSIDDIWLNHMVPVVAPELGEDGSTSAIQMSPAQTPPYSEEELETFRAELDTFVVDLKDLLDYLPDEQAMDTAERLNLSRQVIASASYEQLADVKELYDQYPGYLDTPRTVLGVLQGGQSVDALPGIERNPWLPEKVDMDLLPNVVVPVPSESIPRHPNCRTYGGTGIADNGTCTGCPAAPAGGMSTVFALETAAFVNGAICEYIPEAIFVLSVSIQNPFKLLCTTLRTGLEIAAASVALANNLNGDCEEAYHLGIIHAYLDAEVSSRASQQSFDFYTRTSMRLDMENDLLNELDDRVSTFQMPFEQDGYLDRLDDLSVRWVVTDTIGMQYAAGYTDLRNAETEYAAAEQHLQDEEWKNAYARYRKAYRAAVRVGRQP